MRGAASRDSGDWLPAFAARWPVRWPGAGYAAGMRGAVVIAVLLGLTAPASADDWMVAADVRAGSSFETDGAAPTQRATLTPTTHVSVDRRVGSRWLLGVRVRAGFPAFYGQVGADLGLTREWKTAGPSVFLRVASGIAYTYHDASPEVQYDSDAVIFWGPLARAECGARWWRPAAADPFQRIGFAVSLAGEVLRSRYAEPGSGNGTRAAADVGAGIVAAW